MNTFLHHLLLCLFRRSKNVIIWRFPTLLFIRMSTVEHFWLIYEVLDPELECILNLFKTLKNACHLAINGWKMIWNLDGVWPHLERWMDANKLLIAKKDTKSGSTLKGYHTFQIQDKLIRPEIKYLPMLPFSESCHKSDAPCTPITKNSRHSQVAKDPR